MSKRAVVVSTILAAVLMATVMTGTVSAAGRQDPEGISKGMQRHAKAVEARGFVDADGDGEPDCDSISDRAGRGRYARGDGVPDLDGDNSVDADGDGSCDNCDGDCTPGTGTNLDRLGGRRGGRIR